MLDNDNPLEIVQGLMMEGRGSGDGVEVRGSILIEASGKSSSTIMIARRRGAGRCRSHGGGHGKRGGHDGSGHIGCIRGGGCDHVRLRNRNTVGEGYTTLYHS